MFVKGTGRMKESCNMKMGIHTMRRLIMGLVLLRTEEPQMSLLPTFSQTPNQNCALDALRASSLKTYYIESLRVHPSSYHLSDKSLMFTALDPSRPLGKSNKS